MRKIKTSWQLMPPAKGLCEKCAVKHDSANPHDATSLYYQIRHYDENGRWPTWKDAVAHCAKDIQEAWEKELRKRGAWTE